MQTLYMVICRDALYLYEKDGTGFKRQYIEGNPEFHYQTNHMKDDVKKLLDVLVEEYNLDGRSELTFCLIENEEPSVTKAVCRNLDGYISRQYSLDMIIPEIIRKTKADGIPLIEESGINFDDRNYLPVNGKINKRDFNLLGYTLDMDKMMEYAGQEKL